MVAHLAARHSRPNFKIVHGIRWLLPHWGKVESDALCANNNPTTPHDTTYACGCRTSGFANNPLISVVAHLTTVNLNSWKLRSVRRTFAPNTSCGVSYAKSSRSSSLLGLSAFSRRPLRQPITGGRRTTSRREAKLLSRTATESAGFSAPGI